MGGVDNRTDGVVVLDQTGGEGGVVVGAHAQRVAGVGVVGVGQAKHSHHHSRASRYQTSVVESN